MTSPDTRTRDARKPKKHRHEFTALSWHFGPYGRQDVHVHSCLTEGCDRVLIGDGRGCDRATPHRRESL